MGYDRMTIGPTPAVCYGAPSDRVWLFVHGQGGCKEEAAAFAASCGTGRRRSCEPPIRPLPYPISII